jgi:UPF0755 protein
VNEKEQLDEVAQGDTSSTVGANDSPPDIKLESELTLPPQHDPAPESPTAIDAAQQSLSQANESTQAVKNPQSDTEGIRTLLADVSAHSKSGTVTFTKTAQVARKPAKWRRNLALWLLVLLIPFFAVNVYVRQQLSPVSPGVIAEHKLGAEPGWGVNQLATVLERTGLLRFYMRQQLAPVNPATSTPVEFEVIPGWGATQVANALEQAGIIRNARMFTFYLRGQKLDRNIGEGLYDLSPAMSSADIASILNKGGRPRSVRVVIPEGFRMKDIARTLANAKVADEQTLLELFQKSNGATFIDDTRPLEGYLFPASYDIPVKSTPEEVVQFFLNRFEQELTPEVEATLKERGWTVQGWVTLASIVQSEAANATEMPIIAGVFINRLEEGMPLQSDPTVAYGLGKNLPELDRSAGDFEATNDWNTYARTGLPSTPINNPGREALQAVLNPQRENEEGQKYFYFLHGMDNGQPVFKPNLTFEAHLRDSELYLQ